MEASAGVRLRAELSHITPLSSPGDSCLLMLPPPHPLPEKGGDGGKKKKRVNEVPPCIVPPRHCVFCVSHNRGATRLLLQSMGLEGPSLLPEKQHGCPQWFQGPLFQVKEGDAFFFCKWLTDSQHESSGM